MDCCCRDSSIVGCHDSLTRTKRACSVRNIWKGLTTLTPLAIAALGILILRRPSLIRSWVTTVWFPDNACPMRKESAAEANSAFAAAS